MRAVRRWILGFALTACLVVAGGAHAAIDRPFPLITVTGEATVSVQPDMASAVAGVSSEGKTPREAADANAKAMTAVVSALKQHGVSDTDIRTARFSFAPIYTQRERGDPRISGYRVSNQVQVTIRDLSKLGEILDKLVSAGATDISALQFSVSEASKLSDQARTAAFADARRKAELLAKAAGAQIGRAVNIAEEEAQSPRPMRMMAQSANRMAPPPIETGEETLQARVTVSFELYQ